MFTSMNASNTETKVSDKGFTTITFRCSEAFRIRLKVFCARTPGATQQSVLIEGATKLMDAQERRRK